MEVTLKKAWKNHPAGTVLESVSSGVMKDLKALGVLDTRRKKLPKKQATPVIEEKTKEVISPVNKMISTSPEKKEEGESSPSYSRRNR